VTILLGAPLGPLVAPAAGASRATIALIKGHSHAVRHRHNWHRGARHRTRAYRGRHLAGALNVPKGPRLPRATSLTNAPPPAIAAVLATACQNTELMPSPANLELVRQSVLCLVNRERAENGESPLTLNAHLAQAAQGHSDELVSADYFQHVSRSGVTPVDRIRGTGYIPSPDVGYVIGENLAWGTYSLGTPQAIVAAWIASPGHLANILESHYTETGIGVTPAVPMSLADGAPGGTYAQEFGVIVY
jgi:uncharacterized protein YkwD